jgi:hypothetical protein
MKSINVCQLLRGSSKHDWDFHFMVKKSGQSILQYKTRHSGSMSPEANNQFMLEFIL